MAQAGETLDQTGLAAPEEFGVVRLDEDALWAMLSRRTEFGTSDRWLEQQAQPISWPPAGAPPKEPRAKKRFLGRS